MVEKEAEPKRKIATTKKCKDVIHICNFVPDSNSDCSGCISDHVLIVPWMMVFSPALTILSSFVIFVFVYHFCQKTGTYCYLTSFLTFVSKQKMSDQLFIQ